MASTLATAPEAVTLEIVAAADIWFRAYVRETVGAWEKLPKRRTARDEDLLAYAVGELGERYVVRRLASAGYHAAQAPGSRSPSDVWGMAIVSGIVHVPLLQVRSAEDEPEDLSKTEQVTFARFTAFAFDQFKSSQVVPVSSRTAPLVVSAWYAGVQLCDKPKLVGWDHVYATHGDQLEDVARSLLRAFEENF